METLASWMLVVSMLAGGLGSPKWHVREKSTAQLMAFVNEHDVPDLIVPYFTHPDPEVRMRAYSIVIQYYNPRPSKAKTYPKITSYNGTEDATWRDAFNKAFDLEWTYGGPEQNWEGGNGIWTSRGEGAERLATLHFIRARWKQTLGPRKKMVDFLDEMWQNEKNEEVFKLPDIINNQYGMGDPCSLPFPRRK